MTYPVADVGEGQFSILLSPHCGPIWFQYILDVFQNQMFLHPEKLRNPSMANPGSDTNYFTYFIVFLEQL